MRRSKVIIISLLISLLFLPSLTAYAQTEPALKAEVDKTCTASGQLGQACKYIYGGETSSVDGEGQFLCGGTPDHRIYDKVTGKTIPNAWISITSYARGAPYEKLRTPDYNGNGTGDGLYKYWSYGLSLSDAGEPIWRQIAEEITFGAPGYKTRTWRLNGNDDTLTEGTQNPCFTREEVLSDGKVNDIGDSPVGGVALDPDTSPKTAGCYRFLADPDKDPPIDGQIPGYDVKCMTTEEADSQDSKFQYEIIGDAYNDVNACTTDQNPCDIWYVVYAGCRPGYVPPNERLGGPYFSEQECRDAEQTREGVSPVPAGYQISRSCPVCPTGYRYSFQELPEGTGRCYKNNGDTEEDFTQPEKYSTCVLNKCVMGKGCVGDLMETRAVIPPCKSFLNTEDAKDGNCETVLTAIGDIKINPIEFVQNLFGIILSLAGGIALILIIRAGYGMMTSQGNAEAVQNARDTITSAIVGLLFIIFSLVVLEVIGVDILRLPGFGSNGNNGKTLEAPLTEENIKFTSPSPLPSE
jgi:hypothetical protein